jgi:hypothetical protein
LKEANEKINYSGGQSGMGFLNLLRLPEPVDWNPSGLSQLALVRSLNLITQSEGDNDELKQSYTKKNKQRPQVAEVLATAPPRARSDARLQYVAVQFRTGLHSRLQSPESTRERLGMKAGGRPTFREMSHSKLGR